MFDCCAFIPIGFILMVAPMMAAGRGWRPFMWTALAEAVLLILMALTNFTVVMDWGGSQNGITLLMSITAYLLLPMLMGGIVLWARHAEKDGIGKICKVCGYDLRASPVRCPECGTPVNFDPDRF